MSIDFQFLRDCVTALRDYKGSVFHMNYTFWDKASLDQLYLDTNLCDTPACVIGHYIAHFHGYLGRTGRRSLTRTLLNLTSPGAEFKRVNGLTWAQRMELFDSDGCGHAQTKEEAIAYIQAFIVRHGGSIEDPRPLDVAVMPDWQQIAAVATPVIVQETQT